jgi:ectoine hydroxylase-related dioxygenase (phytanoyl-CoA dioxygenase family)
MLKDLIKSFKENGFVTVPDVFSLSEIEFYREVIKDAIKERKQHDLRHLKDKSEYEQSFIQCQNLWEDYPVIRELTFDQRLGEIASNLLGVSKLRVWHDQALVKEAGGRETDTHQDQAYWPIKETNTITAWIPMVPITKDNGHMGFFPGSHKMREKRFINIFKGKVDQEELDEVPQLKGLSHEYVDLNPGDVSFHHGLTFHNAKPNKSSDDRPVFTIIYFADGSTRGSDQFHFSVDRASIGVGKKIESDVTPLAFPIPKPPNRPKEPISDEFVFPKSLGLLPRD